MQKIGKRLRDFAKTINSPISFKMVFCIRLQRSKRRWLLGRGWGSCCLLYIIFKRFLFKLDCLESLMILIKNLKPCITVVIEVEANHNSQGFMDRFNEALFYYNAIFDNIDACMDQFNTNRICIEWIYLSHMIRSIVATEGAKRTVQHENMDYWRVFFFFARFGMVETELSTSSLCQLNLVVKKFPYGCCRTLTMDRKCLIIGWKGTSSLILIKLLFICFIYLPCV